MRTAYMAVISILIFGLGSAACGGGSACGDCDDGIACTSDSCEPGSGTCSHSPDHSLCGLGYVCDPQLGCVAAPPCTVNADCDDHNPCTFDVCEATGCSHTANSLACDDGDACTVGDTCTGGTCQGTARDCDDGNPCTDDSCDPDSGCVVDYNEAACDDGNPCTSGDHCQAGACSGTLAGCDDGNPCTTDSCDPQAGCQHQDNSFSCDDADACTTADTCSGGTCLGTARQCDDGNPCTDDSCNPQSGCVSTDNTAACDDGNPCTSGDTCAGGTCVGGTNVCTCQNDGDCASYEDGNPCNGTLICQNTECVVDPGTVVVCDTSGDTPCRHNTCDPADGVCRPLSADDGTACDDQDACTTDETCQAGQCTGNAVGCDDGNGCTDDGCDPQTGCTHTHNTDSCDDQNPCTTGDTCNNGSCQGAPMDCDDDDPCTTDACSPGSGCTHTDNSAPCDDGDACTQADTCSAGDCQPGQEICCTGGTDDDGDGATDCDDAGCQDDPACIQYQVDWCRLHFPAAIDALEGSRVAVYGHLYVLGLTDRSAAVDDHPDLRAELGVGPDGSQPDSGGWSWIDAAANPAWDDAQEPGNDEYMAELTVPQAAGSPYDYAYRFSMDGGASWTYCDTNAGDGSDGSQDGYQPANAGALTARSASFQVDWCRLHFPASIDQEEGSQATVYGHLSIAGLTDQTSGNDPHADVLAQLGFGPDGSDPGAGSWCWTDARPNPAWDDAQEPGNDEYMAELLVPPAPGSPYDYAYRFSADAGASWTYCDLDAGDGSDGSQDGYQPANAGALTAQAGAHDDSNWDFEESWAAGDNPPDFLRSTVALEAAPEGDLVDDGAQACRLTWSGAEPQGLQTGWLWAGVQPAVAYTLHAWIYDDDAGAEVRPVLFFGSSADAGAAAAGGAAFGELTHTASTGAAAPWLAGGLELVAAGADPVSLVVDDFDLTRHLAFDATDGELEAWSETSPAAPVEWAASPLSLYAALNDEGVLYAATDPMPAGPTDLMLFVWVGGVDPAASVPLPWGKTGQLAGPAAGATLLALIQEEANGYCQWARYDGAGTWSQVAGDCVRGSVLEGALDLAALTGLAPAALPAEVALAAARINTGDGGTIWSSSQTPTCVDCVNDRIDPDETLPVHRARLLVGRIH